MSLWGSGQIAETSPNAPNPTEEVDERCLKWRVARDNFTKILDECNNNHKLIDELNILDDYGHGCYYGQRYVDCRGALASIIRTVLRNLQKDSLCWDKFLQVLKDSDLESLATQLESDLKSRMPGYQGKYNMTPDQGGSVDIKCTHNSQRTVTKKKFGPS